MGHRSNQPATGRDFYFSPSGDNILSGTSDENPVADPQTAIDHVNALIPIPSGSEPASINASVTGAYTQNLILPDFTSVNCNFASILNFTPSTTNITAGRTQESSWGSVLALGADSVCYRIDGIARHEALVNAVVPSADDCIGFIVTGVCDDIFIRVVLAEVRGERSMLVDHTATSPSPINYHFDLVEMFDIDQTMVDYNPVPGSSQTVIEMTTGQEAEGATTTGCVLFKVRAGTLVVTAEVLSCHTVTDVYDGALLTLSAQVINGDTLVQDGGICVYKGLSLLQGDMETQGAGTLQLDASNITGTATNAGSMSIQTTQFDGEIINTGTMFVIIGNYTGTMPDNDGSINGSINGVRYGTWREELLLRGADFTDQIPLGLDTPLQITFGSAQGSGSDPVMLSAAGALTANVPNEYHLHIFLQYGRTGAGMFSKLFFRVLVNGTQVGDSIEAKLDNANSDVPIQLSSVVPMVAGDVLTFELVRDSGGGDSGQLVSEAPVLGWNSAPSAVIRVSI